MKPDLNSCHAFFAKNLFRILGRGEFADLKRASQDPRKSQEKCLRTILGYARDSVFGREHNFSTILEAPDFEELVRRYHANVSPAEYEDFRPYVNRMTAGGKDILFNGYPVLYATTSGSTGEPKWIPISHEYLHNIYGRMSRAWVYSLAKACPDAFSGSILTITGKAVEGYSASGVPFGSVSAFIRRGLPKMVKNAYCVPPQIFDIDDYAVRNYVLMRLCLEKDVRIVGTANPSTIVELQHTVEANIGDMIDDIEHGTVNGRYDLPDYIRKKVEAAISPNPHRAEELRRLLREHGTLLPKHYWPNLKLMTTWRCGNTSIYLNKMEGFFPEGMKHMELGYFASECRFGLVIDDSVNSVLCPHFHFYEFKKADEFEDPDAPFYQLHELVPGQQYCPFVTTFSGLYRYNMNDIVQACPPLLGKTVTVHMLQKVNGIVTITGEKLYEKKFIDAVNEAQASTSRQLNYYAGYANVDKSRYDLYLEFEDKNISQEEAEKFGKIIDDNLKKSNIEYKAKRESFRLKDPAIFRLKEKAFDLFKEYIVNRTKQDATRFKPNVLAQNEERHKIISKFVKGRKEK